MWFDVLKNTKTISQTSGSFDFDEEEIPEETDNNCLMDLRKIIERAKNMQLVAGVLSKRFEIKLILSATDNPLKGISNEAACFLLDKIKQLDFSIHKDGISLLTGGSSDNFGDYHIYAGINKTYPHLRGQFGPHSEENHISSIFFIEDKKGQKLFSLQINWLFTKEIEEKGGRSKNYSIYEKAYSDICKRILGV